MVFDGFLVIEWMNENERFYSVNVLVLDIFVGNIFKIILEMCFLFEVIKVVEG